MGEASEEGRSPRAAEALLLLAIVSGVAVAGRVLAPVGIATARQSAIVVAVAAALIGLPALAWLFERARLGVKTLVVVGAAAGAIPPLLFLISGAVGLLLLGGGEYAVWALGQAASIPIYGPLPWFRFLAFVIWSVLVGAASGAIFALVVPGRGWRRPTSWGLVLAIVAGMTVVGRWL